MVSYATVRPQIRSGDLLAWSHYGWGSFYDLQIQAVRLFQRSEYCHVGIAWAVGGRVFVLEAVKPKVRIFPLSKLSPFYWSPMSADWNPEGEEFALSNIGGEYSKWQAITAFLNKLKIGEDTKWECAEYVIEVLRRCGIDLDCRATPSAVVLAAQQRGAPLHYVGR